MRSPFKLLVLVPLVISCTANEPFAGSEDGEVTKELMRRTTAFDVLDGLEVPESAIAEGLELRAKFARMVERSVLHQETNGGPEDGGLSEKITITYIGKARFQGPADRVGPRPRTPVAEDVALASVPDQLLDGALWFDGASGASGNEFRIRIPTGLAHAIGDKSQAEGMHLGATAAHDPEDDVSSTGVAKGFSNNVDNRIRFGPLNAPHTSSNYRKLVQVNGGPTGGCSGSLVGPAHTLSAAHCVWNWTGQNQGFWSTGTLRAGRNGTGVVASGSITPSATNGVWYWVPSQFRASSTDPTAGPWDIGMFVTITDRLGDQVGAWFGWAWYFSDSSFEAPRKFHRGYPACGLWNPPANCQQNHLYGDSQADCANVGAYSALEDSVGIPYTFRAGCDASPGHSGGPYYESYATRKVVVGVQTGEYTGNTGPRPYVSTRIGRDYSDAIVVLRNMFP